MAAKKGKDTLKDLSKFLQEKDSAAEENAGGEAGSEDFLSSKPKTLVAVSRLQEALKANQDPDEAFLVEAIEKLAELRGTTTRQALYSAIEAVLGELGELNAADLLLLSSVQYLAHSQRMDSKLQELLKK